MTDDGAHVTGRWDKPWPFNPESDLPPDGASVTVEDSTFVFRDGTLPGWWGDGTVYCRPFSPPGIALARTWAVRQATA